MLNMQVKYILLALFATVASAAEEPIVVTFHARPPYLVPDGDGVPTGLTGSPAAQAFHKAGIPVTWMVAPTNRQLAMVKEAQSRSCAIGWFRNPVREKFAKFTRAVYRDKNWMMLAHAGFVIPEGATLEQVLLNRATRVMVKDNFSYGVEIDALMARTKPTLASTTGSAEQMLQSVSVGTADFMFVSEEEGSYMLSQSAERSHNLRLLRAKDMPHGTERYIMCGKGVPDDVIQRLNKALPAIK